MHNKKVYFVTCDGDDCEYETLHHDTVQEVQKEMKEEGWKTRHGDNHFCPDCVETMKSIV